MERLPPGKRCRHQCRAAVRLGLPHPRRHHPAGHTAGDTNKAYVDARWEIEGPSGIFLGLGLGAAVHDGLLDPTDPDRKALGSRVLFHLPIEIGWRFDERNSISVYFEHISNGFLADSNEGLDSIGVRYGYRF